MAAARRSTRCDINRWYSLYFRRVKCDNYHGRFHRPSGPCTIEDRSAELDRSRAPAAYSASAPPTPWRLRSRRRRRTPLEHGGPRALFRRRRRGSASRSTAATAIPRCARWSSDAGARPRRGRPALRERDGDVTTTAFALLKAGDHVILFRDVYRRTRQFVIGVLSPARRRRTRWSTRARSISSRRPSGRARASRSARSPTNPTSTVSTCPASPRSARRRG